MTPEDHKPVFRIPPVAVVLGILIYGAFFLLAFGIYELVK